MDHFLNVLVSNQLLAISLAGVVWVIVKWEWISRRPALVHGLWMLVLVKCVTPPLVDLPMLPSIAPRNIPTRQREDVDSKKVLAPPQSGALPVKHLTTSMDSDSNLNPATASLRFTFAMFVILGKHLCKM